MLSASASSTSTTPKLLAEYVWRYGAFEESADGTGRVARQDFPHGLRESFRRSPSRDAPTFVWLPGTQWSSREAATLHHPATEARPVAERSEHLDLQQYAEEHPDIEVFARRVIALHRGMLRYYVQMRFLTPAEVGVLRNPSDPLFEPIGASKNGALNSGRRTRRLKSPRILSLLFAVRSRATSTTPSSHERGAELLETVVQHPDGRAIAIETTERSRAPRVHDDCNRPGAAQAVHGPRRRGDGDASEPL